MSQIREKFEKLFEGKMSQEEGREFLISLYEKGESAEEIATAVEVMRSHSIKLPISEELQDKIIDVVGTGGDKSGSFNISTTTSLLLASTGSFVAKHGNRSITSKSGSADLLEALGVNLNLDTQKQVKMLEEVNFCFIFAINHHPAMKHIMPIRKSIPHRTIFNILGPLTNPAGAKKYLMGVFSSDFIDKMAKTLQILEAKKAFVVSSRDGMDEISISDGSDYAMLENKEVKRGVIDPQEYGFGLYPHSEILGGDAKENAKITQGVLSGEIEGAKRDIVLLNSAFALVADERARDIQEGIEIAREAIDSKRAVEHLKRVIEVSNKL